MGLIAVILGWAYNKYIYLSQAHDPNVPKPECQLIIFQQKIVVNHALTDNYDFWQASLPLTVHLLAQKCHHLQWAFSLISMRGFAPGP